MLKNTAPLQNVLKHATPDDVAAGRSWYREANAFARELAAVSGYSFDTICRLLAILSPACPWDRNKKDAMAMALSLNPAGITVSTYGNNKKKAVELLVNGRADALSGLKVTSFYHNIKDPACPENVTIDRHAIRACLPSTKRKDGVDVTPARYQKAARLYKKLAGRVGLAPCELQAVVWVVFKKYYLNQST